MNILGLISQLIGIKTLRLTAPTHPDYNYKTTLRVFLYKPFIFFCPDSLTQPFPPPQIFFCPASLTPPPTNLPYTVPHAASHQPPSRSSSLIHAAAAPHSVTPQLLSVTPQILSVTPQILAQSRHRSADPCLATPQLCTIT